MAGNVSNFRGRGPRAARPCALATGAGQAGKDHGRDPEANWNSAVEPRAGVDADLVEAFGSGLFRNQADTALRPAKAAAVSQVRYRPYGAAYKAFLY